MLENNVTALIKAFKRPHAVKNLYESIRNFYPNLKIVIVDDSEEAMDQSIFDENVNYIHTEFDIGLSAGRNLGIKNIDTKYFLLLDDDFLFIEDTKIEKMYDILENKGFDIVAGGVHDFGTKPRSFQGIFKKKDTTLMLLDKSYRKKHNGYKCYDYVINFFLGKTDLIKNNLWTPELKLAEHEDFFYNLSKNRNVNMTAIKDVYVEHYPENTMSYDEYRDRFYEMIHFSCKKNDVENIIYCRNYSKIGMIIGKPMQFVYHKIYATLPVKYRGYIKSFLRKYRDNLLLLFTTVNDMSHKSQAKKDKK